MNDKHKKLSVILVCAEYPYKNQPTGGFGTYIKHLSQALASRGHSITIICQGVKQQTFTKDKCKVLVIVPTLLPLINLLKNQPIHLFKRIGNFLSYPLLFSFAAAKTIKNITKKEHVDIIEAGEYAGELFFYLLLFKQKLPKTVIKLHTPTFLIRRYNKENTNLFYAIMEFIEKYCLKRVDSIYSPSQTIAKQIKQELSKPINKIIPHPFKASYLKIKSITSKPKIVLFAGKLQTKKGVFLLARSIPQVVKKFPQVKFIFAGPDTTENGQSIKQILLSQFKKENCLNVVKFLGNLKPKQLNFLYKRATITVIPSLWDSYSYVALEALSQGSQVVVSRAAGVAENLKSAKIKVFSPNNPSALTKSIIDLLNSKYAKSYKKLQNIFNAHDDKTIALKTQKYYRKVLS